MDHARLFKWDSFLSYGQLAHRFRVADVEVDEAVCHSSEQAPPAVRIFVVRDQSPPGPDDETSTGRPSGYGRQNVGGHHVGMNDLGLLAPDLAADCAKKSDRSGHRIMPAGAAQAGSRGQVNVIPSSSSVWSGPDPKRQISDGWKRLLSSPLTRRTSCLSAPPISRDPIT